MNTCSVADCMESTSEYCDECKQPLCCLCAVDDGDLSVMLCPTCAEEAEER